MRVIFMGTPEIAVPAFLAIRAAGHEVVATYCQPPRLAGRGMELRKSPVHREAEAAGIPVRTPRSLKSENEQAAFRALQPDVAVVIAYGLLLPRPILVAPRLGCLNMHGSALPRWRGAAPLQRAIMAGDTETAATIMRMDEGLDTGPVCLTKPIAIGTDMTAGDLHDCMMTVGATLMVKALADLERGTLTCAPQPAEGVTYAAKIEKAEARIDLSLPASVVHNRIRGLSPFPGAWLEAGPDGKRERIKVLRSTLAEGKGTLGSVLDGIEAVIACGDGAIRLVEVQRAGRKPVSGAELMRGFNIGRL